MDEELMDDRCCTTCKYNNADDTEEEVVCEINEDLMAPDCVCPCFEY